MSLRDFPGGSVVEILVCHCRGVRDGSPVWEVRFHMWTGRAENKREGRENMGPPGVLESLTSASPVFKKKKSLRLAVSFPPHLFPSLRLILLLCIGSASSNHQSSKYSPLMVPHPGLKKRQPQAPGAGDGGGTGMCFLLTLHTGFLLPLKETLHCSFQRVPVACSCPPTT